MMLAYKKERFVDLLPELPEIFYQHWLAIALNKETIPLSPAWDEYRRLEQAGFLHIMAARDGEKLVGYFFAIVHPHLHYSSVLTANSDMFYIRKEYTRGLAGAVRLRALVRASEKMFNVLGVKKVYIAIKLSKDLSKLFEREGYTIIEFVVHKLL